MHEVQTHSAPAAAPSPATRGRAIVVTSGKGGVGKTTTTANVGAALAQSRDAEVHDIQAEVEVLAKASGLHHGGQIAVGGGQDASLD
ncbi:MAG: P-loop NTPase, partial [Candidatus Velthaea sp.]